MKVRFNLLPLLPVLLLLFSCSNVDTGNPAPDPGRPGYISLEVMVPGHTEVATRALEAIDECEVQTVDILAFNKDTDKFIFREEGTDIKDDPSGTNGNKKIFHVKIPQDGNVSTIYLMVIANARQNVLDAIGAGQITTSKTRDDVMRSLTFASSGVWPVKPGIFTRFPMWGLSQNIDLTATAVTVAPISLMRSVAKIDVGINFPENSDVAAGLGTLFKLEEIYLYNSHNKLLIAPDPSNYSGTVASAVSIPQGVGINLPLKYDIRLYNASKIAHMNEIYLAEHALGSQVDRDKNLCLVIGARFGSTTAEGTKITYYRVDFIKTTRDQQGNVLTQDFLPILRNHRYKVNITKVHGQGYDTVDEAYKAMGLNTNLTVDIVSSDESLTEYVYDGQYALGVGKGDFILDKRAQSDISLVVHTTHEQGWKATVSSGSSWLNITSGTDRQTNAGKSVLKFNVTANSGTERIGKITIQSGRLFKDIIITQRNIGFIEIVNKMDWYLMDGSKTHKFQVKSTYDWQVKVKNDDYNILRTFTTSGTANLTGSDFTFKMENDIFYQTIIDQSAVLTFYSLTGEFQDFDVPIRGTAYYDLGGLYVWISDQPTGRNWYVYTNTPEGSNAYSVPPVSGAQSNPPRTYSCADIPGAPIGKPWRMPTLAEAVAIRNAAASRGGTASYGFSNEYYWVANTYSTNSTNIQRAYVLHNNGTQSYAYKNTNYRARCVRTK